MYLPPFYCITQKQIEFPIVDILPVIGDAPVNEGSWACFLLLTTSRRSKSTDCNQTSVGGSSGRYWYFVWRMWMHGQHLFVLFGYCTPLGEWLFCINNFPKTIFILSVTPHSPASAGGGIFIWTAGLATAEVHLFGQCICCTFIRKVYTTNKVHDDSHSAQKVCYQEALHRSLFHRSCPLTIPIATPMCGCEGTNCQTPMDSGFRLPKKDDNKLIRDLFSHSFQEFTGIASSIFVAAGQRPDVIQMAPQ